MLRGSTCPVPGFLATIGLCASCGSAQDCESVHYCYVCLLARRHRARRKHGYKGLPRGRTFTEPNLEHLR